MDEDLKNVLQHVAKISAMVDTCLKQKGTKHQNDRQYTLEQVGDYLSGILHRFPNRGR
jgi:hypothetical protein